VDEYDWDAPAAIVQGGERVTGDLVVVADGTSISQDPSSREKRAAQNLGRYYAYQPT
jgi:hypothetical protein